MKKLLSTIMALVMLLSLVPMAVAEEGGTGGGAEQSNSVYEVTDAAQLVWAAENYTGVVKLMNDVEIEDTVIVTAAITLDMNGHKLFNTKDIWTHPGNDVEGPRKWSLVSVRENGDLTITGNGTFDAKENDVYAIDLFDNGVRCTIEDGTFIGNVHAVYVQYGMLVVNGGTFSVQQVYSTQKPYEFTLNCLDASFKDGSAQIIVNGGSFYKFDPANNKAEGENTSFTGCATTKNGDNYNVTAPVAMIGEKGYATLAAAVADVPTDGAETTITLLRDVDDAHGMAVASGKNFTVDFGGYTYTVTKPGAGSKNTETNAFQLLRDSTITFKNGTIKCDPSNLVQSTDPSCANIKRIIQNYAALTLEDMVIDGTYLFDDGNLPMSFNNQPVTIKGSTSVILKQGATKAFDADGNWGNDPYDRCKVTVDTTGTIDGNIELGQGYLDIKNANVKGGIVLCTSCGTSETEGQADRITISGGTFSVAPDAKYLAEGMIVVPSTDGTFTVKAAKSEDGKTTTEVSKDGKTVTETTTDGNTVTKTETNVDTGVKTETKTENKTEGNVTTRTETVTVKDKDDNTIKTVKDEAVTETKDTSKTTVTTRTTTEDDKTYTVVSKSTESIANGENIRTATAPELVNNEDVMNTDVVVANAPTTASNVTLDAKAAEGYAEKDIPSTVMVEKESLTKLTDDKVNNVIIDTDHATLTLDKTAVKTMESKVEAIDKLTLKVKVTEEKAAEEITKINVNVTAENNEGKNVFPPESANTNGKITITIPYTGNATYLDLWYTTNSGSTYMGRFPVVAGYVSFDVKHFSQYDLIPVASSGSSVIKTGAGSSAASTTQTVTTDLTPGSITKVTVDGKVVDAKYYTVNGSNVTFTAEFLKTLKNGSHTVTVENATKIAKGVFTVNNPTTAVQAPTTADAGIALYAGMAIASVMGTGVVFTSRKRKNH